jgi:hypothetical protein
MIVAVCVSLLSIACPSPKERIRRLGPEVRADLVIFFNRVVTYQQIEDFWRDTLSKPDTGRGQPQRDGVSDTARIRAVQGHEGVSVSFFLNASQAQKEAVEKDVRSSPIVFKILEDTAPADVKKIE